MKREVKFSEGLNGIVEVGDIDWSIFKDESMIHYIGIISPPRFGVALFATMLEHIYFPPKTKKNGLFWLQFLNWGVIGNDKNGKLYVNASPTIKVDKGDKFQMLRWMIVTIPAEYKPQAEACLKKINMIPSHASPVISKFTVDCIELPFIAAVRSWKLKQRPEFPGPFKKLIELNPDHIHYFPVEGKNIFTIENGPGDHSMIRKMGMEGSVNLERQLCDKISGFTDSSPEEQERISKVSGKIMDVINEMMDIKG